MSLVVEFSEVMKNYAGLRPLRIHSLQVAAGERVTIRGLDAGAAEVFVNLVSGATLPDAGTVRTFGRPTSDVADGDEWLASLDRIGIVSPRVVMLEAATVQQNLALPFTLRIDPIPADVAARVSALASECGIAPDALERRAADVPESVRARIHLGRALALDPALLLLEHPTASVPEGERRAYATTLAAAARGRNLTVLAASMDPELAAPVATRALALSGATGVLKPWKKGWF